MGEGDAAAILRDLARVRAVFQLRAIEAVIRGPQVTPASKEENP